MKVFKMQNSMFDGVKSEFNEDTAPKWLKYGGKSGSTMDNSWFWDGHIMTLEVGESTSTDFQTITRIA